MANYSFQSRFVLPIELGIKQQTIRRLRKGQSDLKGHAKVGGPLGLITGPRMKPRHIGTATPQAVEPVTLFLGHDLVVLPEARILGPAPLDAFAKLDGFQDWADLKAFWAETHKGAEEFHGVRIFWGTTFKGPLDVPPA